MHSYAYTDSRANINTRRLICLHNFGSCFLCSSSASRRILAVVVREQMHIPNHAFTLTLNLSHPNLDPQTVTGSFNLLRTQPNGSAPLLRRIDSYISSSHPHLAQSYKRAHTHTHKHQRSCHDPKRSSKAPLTYASNWPPKKAIALKVRTDQSDSGTYQESPI